jgi:four helix bundle protein
MAVARDFKELQVWQNAMDAAVLVFEVSKRFPPEERYDLTSQIRRASRSVASNIAENWRRRRYIAAFRNKLNEAEGEAAEVQTCVICAQRCGYCTADESADIEDRYEKILGQLSHMIDHAESWCPRPTTRT